MDVKVIIGILGLFIVVLGITAYYLDKWIKQDDDLDDMDPYS